jgi:outer membrane protein assembly factor BamB
VTTDGTRIYAVVDGRVYCFDRDGKRLWDVRPLATGAVAITEQGPVVGTETGGIVVLDPANGATLRATVAGGPVRGSAVPLATSVGWVTIHGVISSTADWGREVALSAAGSAAADGDTLFIATLEGRVVAAGQGGVVWEAGLPAPAVAGVALDAERLYVPVGITDGAPGGVVAFDRSGNELWRRQTEAQPGGPLSVRDHVYVPDKDGKVYALDPASGRVVWTAEGFGEFGAQPLIAGDRVYAGNADGRLYLFDGFDGGQIWAHNLGAPVTGDPTLLGDLLVVGLANGRLVALGEP